MKGIVFEGNGKMTVETVPDPTILEPGDAIVRVTKAGICGSDLHILNHGEAFGFEVLHHFVDHLGRGVVVPLGGVVELLTWIELDGLATGLGGFVDGLKDGVEAEAVGLAAGVE